MVVVVVVALVGADTREQQRDQTKRRGQLLEAASQTQPSWTEEDTTKATHNFFFPNRKAIASRLEAIRKNERKKEPFWFLAVRGG